MKCKRTVGKVNACEQESGDGHQGGHLMVHHTEAKPAELECFSGATLYCSTNSNASSLLDGR